MDAILHRYYHQTSFRGLAVMTICKHDVSHCMHQTVFTVCTRPYPTKTNWEFCAMMWKLKVLLSELKFSRGFYDFLTIIHKINNHLFTSTCWGDICTTVVDRKTLVQCQIVCLVRETTYATVILLAVCKSAFAKTRNKPLKGRDPYFFTRSCFYGVFCSCIVTSPSPTSKLEVISFNVIIRRGFKFVAEQVSHHPPISVCHATGDFFKYWQGRRLIIVCWLLLYKKTSSIWR